MKSTSLVSRGLGAVGCVLVAAVAGAQAPPLAARARAAGAGVPRPVRAAARGAEVPGVAQGLRALRGRRAVGLPRHRGLRLRRLLPLRDRQRRARRPEARRGPRGLLRRLDHRQLVEARLRRLLPRQALRQPRHRRADDGADAAALPRRRARALAEGGRDPGRHQRRRRQRGSRYERARSRTTWRAWRSSRGSTASRSCWRRCSPSRTTRRTRPASPSTARASARRPRCAS